MLITAEICSLKTRISIDYRRDTHVHAFTDSHIWSLHRDYNLYLSRVCILEHHYEHINDLYNRSESIFIWTI